jgi:catechol 2,3-dioxygenase-like lactoylglutathione lyase family enzyme
VSREDPLRDARRDPPEQRECKALTADRSEVLPMLESASTHTMIAVKDLSRAREFYTGVLGLTPSDERRGAIRYETRGETWFLVYESAYAGTTKSTSMRFEVEDIERVVEHLRGRGIVFEEYDLPGVKTVG